MPVQACFAVPIYDSIIQPPLFNVIQNDFREVENHLNKNNSFNHNKAWNPGTHRLSDSTFSKNLIIDFNLKVFEKELYNHIRSYLTTLGVPNGAMTEYKITGSWMTKTCKNEYAHQHHHGMADISGVYYYKTNGKDGSIGFRNMMKEFTSLLFQYVPSDVMYEPKVGKIILFPGWLDHYVEPNTTDNERMSVSFNINFKRPEF
jgi:uncharacterized protein (TIGR02466 family)